MSELLFGGGKFPEGDIFIYQLFIGSDWTEPGGLLQYVYRALYI